MAGKPLSHYPFPFSLFPLVATAAYRLSQAAENGNLSSATYQRLNAFLALFSLGSACPGLAVAPGGCAATQGRPEGGPVGLLCSW
jgi:hypothetical protein